MKTIKIILSLVLVLFIVIAGLFYFVLSNLNSLVEDYIENAASTTLQTAVNVDGVNIELLDGKGEISYLTIANPETFSNNHLLAVSDIGLQLDPASLTKSVKVIKRIHVDGVKLRAEQKNIADTNLAALLDNINKSASNKKSSPKKTSSSKSSPDVRLMVESLHFGQSEITVESQQYGSKVITLPAYSQKNIGDKKTGLSPEQLSETIVSNLIRKAEKAVKRRLREEAKDKAEEKIKEKLKEELGDKVSEEDIDKLKNLFK